MIFFSTERRDALFNNRKELPCTGLKDKSIVKPVLMKVALLSFGQEREPSCYAFAIVRLLQLAGGERRQRAGVPVYIDFCGSQLRQLHN